MQKLKRWNKEKRWSEDIKLDAVSHHFNLEHYLTARYFCMLVVSLWCDSDLQCCSQTVVIVVRQALKLLQTPAGEALLEIDDSKQNTDFKTI